MKRVALLVSMLVLAIPVVALAQSGGGYDLSWGSIDGGGGTSSGGSYTLSGTIGQPDAGVLTGGNYILGGGFWGGGTLAEMYKVYLPIVVRQHSNR